MFFLNLTAAEFFSLLGILGGLVSALYLLDRATRRRVVSTLRFWNQAGVSDKRQARRKVRDPWSLILQLLSLLLLLLAISRIEWGSREHRGRDHVLLLDSSSWSAAKLVLDGSASVLGIEKTEALRYLSRLPSNDRVMLVSAESLATPLTGFTTNRQELNGALDQLSSGFTTLDLEAALTVARQGQSFSSGAAGEIVYIGPQLVDESVPGLALDRIIPVRANRENCGIRQLTVEQAEDEPDSWRALIRIKNYGRHGHTMQLQMHYNGTSFAPRHLLVAADAETTAEYLFTTRTPGKLTASIQNSDSLATDNQASVMLPLAEHLRVAVYTDRPALLRPLLTTGGQLSATFLPASKFTSRPPGFDLIVIDKTAVSGSPALPTLWLDPPNDHSPLPVKSADTNALLTWNPLDPLAGALHAKQLRLPSAKVFETFAGDQVIASVPAGPVVLVRPATQNRPKSAVVGFDAIEGQLRFEAATPLLFAELLEQLNANAFRRQTFTAARVGLFTLPLAREEQADTLRVQNDRGFAIPFTRHANTLQFFVSRPSSVHVESENQVRLIHLQLPDVAERFWNAPSSVAIGLPSSRQFARGAIDLWKWLAIAAAICLLFEWLFFGRARTTLRLRRREQFSGSERPLEHASELAVK